MRLTRTALAGIAAAAFAGAGGAMLATDGGAAASSNMGRAATVGELQRTETLDVAERVATRWARNAGVDGELHLSIAETTFARAQAAMEHESPNEAETGGATPVAEWRATPVYMIVMTAGGGTVFAPNVSVPRGATGPTGTQADLAISVNTSEVLGVGLPTSGISLAGLGPVRESSIPADTTATSAGHGAPPPGATLAHIEGAVYTGSRPVKGWHVVMGKPHTNLARHATRTGRTFIHGYFSFTVAPGSYEIAARTPSGKLCAKQQITVKPGGTVHLKLRCAG